MNVKLGGVNSILLPAVRPRIFNEPVMFLGCDITHPPAGEHEWITVVSIRFPLPITPVECFKSQVLSIQ